MKKNVFQLWDDRGRQLPLAVHNRRWAEDTFFLVEEVEIKTGKLYGEAFGKFYHHGVLCGGGFHEDNQPHVPVQRLGLKGAGSYQWDEVKKP